MLLLSKFNNESQVNLKIRSWCRPRLLTLVTRYSCCSKLMDPARKPMRKMSSITSSLSCLLLQMYLLNIVSSILLITLKRDFFETDSAKKRNWICKINKVQRWAIDLRKWVTSLNYSLHRLCKKLQVVEFLVTFSRSESSWSWDRCSRLNQQ